MRGDKRYTFVNSPLFLGLFVLFMLFTSLILSVNAIDLPVRRSFPLLSGIFDIVTLSSSTSYLLSVTVLLIIAFSIYYTNERLFSCGRSSLSLALFYLIISLSGPGSIYFSGAMIAALLLVWSLYFSVLTKKGDTQLFLSLFLISTASLFDFHIIFLVPVIFFYSLTTSSFAVKSVFIALVSASIPYLIILSIRYLLFGDVGEFLSEIFKELININLPLLKIETVAEALVLLSVATLAYRSSFEILKIINRYKVVKSIGLLRYMVILAVLLIITMLYKDFRNPFTVIISVPISFIIMEYLSLKTESNSKRVKFLIMLILLVLIRISHFI